MAALGALGVVAGVLMVRRHDTGGWARRALLTFGWMIGGALTFVIPDYSLLGLLVFSPALLVFAVTGVPGSQELGDILYWHRLNLIILFVGGLLWLATTVAYQRRTGHRCVQCGRGEHSMPSWMQPAAALRWGHWAVWAAVASTLPYDITRIAWYFGWPLGISDPFLKDMQHTPHMLQLGLGLGVVSTLGSLLMHGLTARWGEVWPRWVWFKHGKPVHPATAMVPASLMAVLLIPAGLMALRDFDAAMWGRLGPSCFWVPWGMALGVAAFGYHLRRRRRCGHCGRG